MTLPPLPYVDGSSFYGEPCLALVFDNSALEDWQTCKRLWQHKDLERYQSTQEKAGRNFGSAFHRAKETRYKMIGNGLVTPDCSAAMNAALAAHFSESPAPLDDFRNLSHAQRYVAAYNQIYPKEAFTILRNAKGEPFVEQTFALPFGEVQRHPLVLINGKPQTIRVVYAGKIDLAVEDRSVEWTFDTKTTFQFGRTIEMDWEQNGGQVGYCWAYKAATGRRPAGYIIDGCRVRKPSRNDAYADSAPVDSTDFKRIPYFVTEDAINDWRQDTLALVEEIVWSHARGYFPRHRKACVGKYGPCDFYNVCSVQPSARRQIIESNLYEENKWTPLNSPQ